ncbi:MAG TPA: xanthine dehydrogenase family protein molybdopterin-binding subunit [Syntrophorhabdaceae bacterium]|nr:xanthine dehydrogenase family protein molybdopterin-binding subunit [Syntrophorhabdaceae bacterium]
MAEQYRFIGKPIPRQDARQIVTGKARFLDDITLPDMLYGAVLRSPHAHASIVSIDKTKACALPGVKAVLSWQDIPDWKGGQGNTTRVLDHKVRFVGDAVALVAAQTKKIAEDALRLIDVEYEVIPAIFDPEEAVKPGAPQLYETCPGNIMPPGVPAWGGPKSLQGIMMGDVDHGFAEADVVAEGTFVYDNIANPTPPESPGAIALWEEPNLLTVWVSDQSFYKHVFYLKRIVGKDVEVRTFGGPCGGSYGSKSMSWQVQLYAALLSRATERPVKVIFSKEEHLAAFVLRPASRMCARVGMKKDGTVTAVSGEWMLDTGYYSQTTQAQVAVGCGEAQLAVRCANWNLKTSIVCTNRSASGIVRGFGGQELKCTLIPVLSLAMAKVNLDPVEFFKKNYVKPGDGYFWRDGLWYTYRGIDYAEAMEEGARRFKWKEKWKGWLKPTLANGAKRRGIGVGIHGNADIGEDASEAYVRLDADGSAKIFTCLAEHGTGQKTNITRMAAEVLRLPLARIFQIPSDSLISPHERGPGGSRMTYAAGSAVIKAAEDAIRKLLDMAQPLLGAPSHELETEDGMIFCKDKPERKVPWEAVLGASHTCMGYGRFEQDFTLANCMISFVEVEVDVQSGRASLVQVLNATNVGQIIDPPGLRGQMNGCLGSGGIDSALFEETVLDRRTGHMLNSNMIDYKWRTFTDLPPIENVVLETPIESHRFHAVGVGEVATAPGPVAVFMAVSNAIGTWLHEYPATPERVLSALKAAPANVAENKGDGF